MHDMRIIAANAPVAWASVNQSVSLSVCLSRGVLFLLFRQMAPLLCSYYYTTLTLT